LLLIDWNVQSVCLSVFSSERESVVVVDLSSSSQKRQQEALNSLLTCPAQQFYSRFSLAGEMFTTHAS